MEKQMTLTPSSGAAKAVQYMLKRWSAFERYAHTGHLPIDNNTCENTIRPIALGKKNWLFVGSERAGKRAAAIQLPQNSTDSIPLNGSMRHSKNYPLGLIVASMNSCLFPPTLYRN
jgi:hypothetical protein